MLTVRCLVGALAASDRLEEPLLREASAALERLSKELDGQAQLGPLEAPRGPLAAQPQILQVQPRLCLLWKPPGWSVSISSEDDYDVVLPDVDRSSEESGLPVQQWLMDTVGTGHPIAQDVDSGHGLVHRLDRETSGVLLWARSYSGYHAARLQFAANRTEKRYVCLCHGHAPLKPFSMRAPLQKVVVSGTACRSRVWPTGSRAHTEVVAVAHLVGAQGDRYSLVEVRLHTGRLHQIRAHMSNEGHPLVGDPAYGGVKTAWCPRVFLHAFRISIDIGDGPVTAAVPLPGDLRGALAVLGPSDRAAEEAVSRWSGP